eukprot:NODE_208_length_14728_cov_0.400164.p9 type:complete len:226 gc:universal NODE_208_length_14728_cov_0.400164:6145-5468(-)
MFYILRSPQESKEMTKIKLHNNKIHAITGPFCNLLASYLLVSHPKLYISNPCNMNLYIPRIEKRVSKVSFQNAHHYGHDRVEEVIDHLEPIKSGSININDIVYDITYINTLDYSDADVDGLFIFIGNPTAIQLYNMRKFKLSVIVCCDSILDYTFYDFCFDTFYSNKTLKKTDCCGIIKVMKPYTTDIYTLECKETLIIDLHRLSAIDDEDEDVALDKKQSNADF